MDLATELKNRFRSEFIGRLVAIIAGSVLILLLARLLGAEEYGLLFLAISVCSFLKIFSKFGIAKSAARFIAEYREKDSGQIRHIIKFSLITNLISIFIVSFALVVFSGVISNVLNENQLTNFLIIGSLFVIFESLVTFTRMITQGFEDIEISITIHAFNSLFRLLCSVSLVLLGYGALGALFGYALGAFIGTSIGFAGIYSRHYNRLKESNTMEKGLATRILRYSIPLTVTGASNKIDNQVDTILVGFFLNPLSVSYYVLSKQIVTMIQTPASALGFSISPTYGTTKADDNIETASKMYETSLKQAMLLYIPAATGILILSSEVINNVFGDSYNGAVPVLQLLSIYTVLLAVTKITDGPLDYLGRAKDRSIIKTIASISNFGLNIILIPLIGVVGAALATLITHTFYVSSTIYIINKELEINKKNILKSISKTFIITLVMGSVVVIMSDYISGIISLLGTIITGILIWFMLCIFSGEIKIEKLPI